MENVRDDDAAASDSAVLCTSCAMCCTGVLFTSARAQPSEIPRLEAARLTVEQVGDRLQFRLPCHHNVDGECRIYADRFDKCRTFRCALLKRLDGGEVTLSQALDDVAQAKAMLARVVADDPDAVLVSKRIEKRGNGLSATDDAQARRRWLDSTALDLFLDRKFRNKPLLPGLN